MHTCICICTHADHLAAISDINCMHGMLQVCADVVYVCIIYILCTHMHTYVYVHGLIMLLLFVIYCRRVIMLCMWV